MFPPEWQHDRKIVQKIFLVGTDPCLTKQSENYFNLIWSK
jgi:hypothetical protein